MGVSLPSEIIPHTMRNLARFVAESCVGLVRWDGTSQPAEQSAQDHEGLEKEGILYIAV
ncbi:hypothetical protein TWF481_011810 [Arthrobotrys musiformis]|uniref:Uncharacterized protein n=1 Tax=Arthrobotrys musiformis TaxID=47236 RepID=A0AAV9VWA1_9PEZI